MEGTTHIVVSETTTTANTQLYPELVSPGVLLTGGASTYQSTELYPPVPGCSTPQLPTYRRYHSTFRTEDATIATCGGSDSDGGQLSNCIVLLNNQWQSDTTVMGHLPEKRRRAAEVTVAGVGTYIIGGRQSDGSLLSSSAFLPAGSATWQSGPDLPQALEGACAFSYKQSLLVIRGVVNSRTLGFYYLCHYIMGAIPREKSEEKGPRQKVKLLCLNMKENKRTRQKSTFWLHFFAFWDLFSNIGFWPKKILF